MIDTGTFIGYIVCYFFFLFLMISLIRGTYSLFKNLR